MLLLIFIRHKAHGKYKGNSRKYKGNWTIFYFLDLRYQNELLTTLLASVHRLDRVLPTKQHSQHYFNTFSNELLKQITFLANFLLLKICIDLGIKNIVWEICVLLSNRFLVFSQLYFRLYSL